MANQHNPDSTGSGFGAELVAADGTRYALIGEQTLGRSEDADITIAHPKISRKHACFRLAGQQLTVEDLGSANGTRVNRRRIEGAVVLGDGDVLSFDVVDLTVALTGVVDEGDATVIGVVDDATVVGAWSDAEPEKPAEIPPSPPQPQTPQPQSQSKQAQSEPAQPVPERTAEPAAAASKLKAPPVDKPAVNLPGSWVDQAIGEHTQVLSGLEAASRTGAGLTNERASDLPHLVILLKSGSQQVLELEPGGAEQADVWEIGRDQGCQISIPEESVSARHAQLIHQDGRWRLVNLVSTNGIYVNGQKRLTAYLADGDEIKLGTAALIFRTGSGASTAGPSATKKVEGTAGRPMIGIVLGAVAIAAAVGLWFFLR